MMWKIVILLWIMFLHQGDARNNKNKPKIKDGLKSTYYVRLNDTVRLACKVKKQYKDQRKILFYWIEDRTPIRVDLPRHKIVFNKYLEIRNIRSIDHGTYTCTAVSAFGKDSLLINLVVMDRDDSATPDVPDTSHRLSTPFPIPNFFKDHISVVEAIKHKAFRIGKQAKLKCLIKGSPSPLIKWYHNGKWIPSSDRYIKAKKGRILKISYFSLLDVGNYTCVGVNGKGRVNMTIIASQYIPYRPPKKDVIVTVKPGENLTLTCEVPVNKVKYIHWLLPKTLSGQYRQRTSSIDLQNNDRQLQLDEKNKNETRVETFALYNINQATHMGNYICQAAFVDVIDGEQLYAIKEYKLYFAPEKTYTGNDVAKVLTTIAVPVIAGILSMFVIIGICMRYHKKLIAQRSAAQYNEDTDTHIDDEGDTLSLQILSKQPHGSLTIHRKSTEDDVQYSSKTNFFDYNGVNTLERRVKIDGGTKTKPVKDNTCSVSGKLTTVLSSSSSQLPHVIYKNETSHGSLSIADSPIYSKRSSSSENIKRTSCKSWPGEKLLPGDPDYISFNEDKFHCAHRTSKRRKSSAENSSICSNNKKKDFENNNNNTNCTRSSTSLKVTPNSSPMTPHRSSSASSHSRSTASESRDSTCDEIDDINDRSEEEDQLILREKRIWQPLIKNSIKYSSSKNESEKLDESTKLLLPRATEFVDGSNHFVTCIF